MGAGFKSVTDTSVVEALDFEYAPPCEITTSAYIACDDAAEWIVTDKHHCIPDAVKTKFTCGGHLSKFVSDRGGWRCADCWEMTDSTPDRVIRTERIKS